MTLETILWASVGKGQLGGLHSRGLQGGLGEGQMNSFRGFHFLKHHALYLSFNQMTLRPFET